MTKLILEVVTRGTDSSAVFVSRKDTSYIKATFKSWYQQLNGVLQNDRVQVRSAFIFKTKRPDTYNVQFCVLTPKINKHGKIATVPSWVRGIMFNPTTGKMWIYRNRRSFDILGVQGWNQAMWKEHLTLLITEAIKENQPL